MNEAYDQLKNRFDMSDWREGFSDRFSHFAVSCGTDTMRLKHFSPRGLIEWRTFISNDFADVYIRGYDGRLFPVYVTEHEFLPWKAATRGMCVINGGKITVDSILCCTAFNRYSWGITASLPGGGDCQMVLAGRLGCADGRFECRLIPDGAAFAFIPATQPAPNQHYPQFDGIYPAWSLRSSSAGVSVDPGKKSYQFEISGSLSSGVLNAVLQIDYETVAEDGCRTWTPERGIAGMRAINEASEERKRFYEERIRRIPAGGDEIKKARSCAGLIRCGFRWRKERFGTELTANYCSMTSWASCAFFWDSVSTSMGLAQFDPGLAKEALLALFVRQRDDGCVPTSSYEHAEGSTFYPQAPLAAYAAVRLMRYDRDLDFVRRLTERNDRLLRWFFTTQDQDGDGLYEWRFSGCGADNSPQYDAYARPAVGDRLGGLWCTYLPPVASAGLNAYLMMECKCMSYLYGLIGETRKQREYEDKAKDIGRRLNEICLYGDGCYYDYDHHTRTFSRSLTLYSFLPYWAGINAQDEMRQAAITKSLLCADTFFGDIPFPFLARNDTQYRPDGYWRGRVWPHTAFWMLELLCAYGFTEEADAAAGRLLALMSRTERILENYNSDPALPGGGEPDYNWSLAAYLNIENRVYRDPVLVLVENQEE